jgi:hypothetical protein
MAEHEPDGVNEAFQAATRVAITARGLLAERMMRAREQAMRDAQAHSEQHARELQARMDSERAAAHAALAPVGRDEWWDRAGAEEIGVAWETANAWRDVERDAAHTVEHIRDQLRGRYGIDPDSLEADSGPSKTRWSAGSARSGSPSRRARRPASTRPSPGHCSCPRAPPVATRTASRPTATATAIARPTGSAPRRCMTAQMLAATPRPLRRTHPYSADRARRQPLREQLVAPGGDRGDRKRLHAGLAGGRRDPARSCLDGVYEFQLSPPHSAAPSSLTQ